MAAVCADAIGGNNMPVPILNIQEQITVNDQAYYEGSCYMLNFTMIGHDRCVQLVPRGATANTRTDLVYYEEGLVDWLNAMARRRFALTQTQINAIAEYLTR